MRLILVPSKVRLYISPLLSKKKPTIGLPILSVSIEPTTPTVIRATELQEQNKQNMHRVARQEHGRGIAVHGENRSAVPLPARLAVSAAIWSSGSSRESFHPGGVAIRFRLAPADKVSNVAGWRSAASNPIVYWARRLAAAHGH